MNLHLLAQNVQHFAEDTFKCMFLEQTSCIFNQNY